MYARRKHLDATKFADRGRVGGPFELRYYVSAFGIDSGFIDLPPPTDVPFRRPVPTPSQQRCPNRCGPLAPSAWCGSTRTTSGPTDYGAWRRRWRDGPRAKGQAKNWVRRHGRWTWRALRTTESFSLASADVGDGDGKEQVHDHPAFRPNMRLLMRWLVLSHTSPSCGWLTQHLWLRTTSRQPWA